MKQLIKYLLVLCIVTGICWQNLCAQTVTYEITTKYNLKDAYNFQATHGIEVLTSSSSWTKITVDVKPVASYAIPALLFCGGTQSSQWSIYKAFITPQNIQNGSLQHSGNKARYYKKSFLDYACDSATTDNIAFYKNMALTADELIYNGWWFWGKPIDVIITLTLEGNVKLSDIKKVKVPGAGPWDGGDFLNYTNPCSDPNYPGCSAVADFKNVSDVANKKAIVVAHRGYHGMRTVPENSLEAVKKAYDAGFRYVEVDLRMTKDKVPIFFHDDWFGYVTDFPTLNNTSSLTETEERTWSEIAGYRYRTRYWDKIHKTATNAGNTNVRLGNVSDHTFNSFSQICDYIKNKDIMLYLDIKSVPTDKNLEVMKQCLFIAVEKNVLHQIAVKMIRTNAGAPPDKQLIMTVATVEEQLSGIYRKLKNNMNVHVVDYSPETGIAFIENWTNQGNVVGFEFDASNNMLSSPAFSYKNYPFGLCAWDYTKSLGYRTGVWSSGPIDPRGRPGHDPSVWRTGNAMKITTDPDSYFRYQDNRSRMEIQSMVTPQYVTHDRPDTWVEYLKAVGLYNTKTKRP